MHTDLWPAIPKTKPLKWNSWKPIWGQSFYDQPVIEYTWCGPVYKALLVVGMNLIEDHICSYVDNDDWMIECGYLRPLLLVIFPQESVVVTA